MIQECGLPFNTNATVHGGHPAGTAVIAITRHPVLIMPDQHRWMSFLHTLTWLAVSLRVPVTGQDLKTARPGTGTTTSMPQPLSHSAEAHANATLHSKRGDMSLALNQCAPAFQQAVFLHSSCKRDISHQAYQINCVEPNIINIDILTINGHCPENHICVEPEWPSAYVLTAFCVPTKNILDLFLRGGPPDPQQPAKHAHATAPAAHLLPRDSPAPSSTVMPLKKREQMSYAMNQCVPPFVEAFFVTSMCHSAHTYQIFCLQNNQHEFNNHNFDIFRINGYCPQNHICVDRAWRAGRPTTAFCVSTKTIIDFIVRGDRIDPPPPPPKQAPASAPAAQLTPRDASAPSSIAKRGHASIAMNQCSPPFLEATFFTSFCYSPYAYQICCTPTNLYSLNIRSIRGRCPQNHICIEALPQSAHALTAFCVPTKAIIDLIVRGDRSRLQAPAPAPAIQLLPRDANGSSPVAKRDMSLPLDNCHPHFLNSVFLSSGCRRHISLQSYEIRCIVDPAFAVSALVGSCPQGYFCANGHTSANTVYYAKAYCVPVKNILDFINQGERSNPPRPSSANQLLPRDLPAPHSVAKRDQSIAQDYCTHYPFGIFRGSHCYRNRGRSAYQIRCEMEVSLAVHITSGFCPQAHICVNGRVPVNMLYGTAYCVPVKNIIDFVNRGNHVGPPGDDQWDGAEVVQQLQAGGGGQPLVERADVRGVPPVVDRLAEDQGEIADAEPRYASSEGDAERRD